eukprot:jgi/Botrbrau1/653/Bobra.0161s0041.1
MNISTIARGVAYMPHENASGRPRRLAAIACALAILIMSAQDSAAKGSYSESRRLLQSTTSNVAPAPGPLVAGLVSNSPAKNISAGPLEAEGPEVPLERPAMGIKGKGITSYGRVIYCSSPTKCSG